MAKVKSLDEVLKNFNPNDPASDSAGVFGLPFSPDQSKLVLYPVEWEATVSYQSGTAKGPAAVLEASKQVDLYDPIAPNAWKQGISMLKPNKSISALSKKMRPKVEKYLDGLVAGKTNKTILSEVNEACVWMNNQVRSDIRALLEKGHLVGMLGGDHSTPMGYFAALSAMGEEFGILQIDAHCDLRNAYEGFTYSHASIMYNALQLKGVKALVQVGIRDYCEEEMNLINSDKRISTFFDRDLKRAQIEGKTWKNLVDAIIKKLPAKVFISFDIDGLDPKMCPNTGTPVPGGLEYEQAIYLMESLIKAKKKIIGFDLNEVAPGKDEWDANVGARLLFKMCHIILKANA